MTGDSKMMRKEALRDLRKKASRMHMVDEADKPALMIMIGLPSKDGYDLDKKKREDDESEE